MNSRDGRRVFIPQRAPAPPMPPIPKWPERASFEGGHRGIPPAYTGGAIYLGRSMICEAVTVGTTPTLLKSSPQAWPYMFFNPALSLGLSSTTNISLTKYEDDTDASGNDLRRSTAIDVTGYEYAHIFLYWYNAHASTEGNILLQAYNSRTSTWYTAQTLWEGIEYNDINTPRMYAMAGPLGMVGNVALYFDISGAIWVQCTIDVVLTGGNGAGLTDTSRTVYLGDQNVTTTAGFPLLPGQREVFILGENVEVWGITDTEHAIRVFSL